MRAGTPIRIAALALFAALVAARLGLHPNTPYKSFLLSLAPVAGAWLVLGTLTVRWRVIQALTALASTGLVAIWCFKAPDGLAPLPVAGTAAALIGVWLALMLLAALLTGALNAYFRHGPMTALGFGLVVYALASGFMPLPLGAPAMTVGMLWLALWQGIYLYRGQLS